MALQAQLRIARKRALTFISARSLLGLHRCHPLCITIIPLFAEKLILISTVTEKKATIDQFWMVPRSEEAAWALSVSRTVRLRPLPLCTSTIRYRMTRTFTQREEITKCKGCSRTLFKELRSPRSLQIHHLIDVNRVLYSTRAVATCKTWRKNRLRCHFRWAAKGRRRRWTHRIWSSTRI